MILFLTLKTSNMIIVTLRFNDCEHYGDLDDHKIDVRNSGGKITDFGVDYQNEKGWIVASVPEDFWKKFELTSAYGFMD